MGLLGWIGGIFAGKSVYDSVAGDDDGLSVTGVVAGVAAGGVVKELVDVVDDELGISDAIDDILG